VTRSRRLPLVLPLPLPLILVLVASVAFHLPAILHATQTNSDASVVALQAIHFLRGAPSDWSWFLWGSGYQTSVDSAFAALAFGLFGPTARTLVLSSLALHLLLTSLAWSTLARRLDPVRAALAVLPLVFASSPLQTYVLYPPRQASLTIAVAALWALDRAADARRARAFATGAALLALASFADPYALVLVPPIAAFGLACAIDRADPRASLARVTALLAGGIAGAVPLVLLRASPRATHGQLALALDLTSVARNAHLLVAPCLPWTLGAQAWTASTAIEYVPWDGPLAARALMIAGGTLFLVAIILGGACVFARRLSLPWTVRRLAIAGALALPVTVAGYLVSPMVFDLFSARYLAAIPLLAPFALAPLAAAFGTRRFALLMAPCAAASAIAGWVGYGPFLRDAPSDPSDETKLEEALASRGVHLAMADYWAAYRLTFLTNERLIVVPTNAAEDRYPPYRTAFEAAPTVAYVFDPERSREPATWMQERLVASATPYASLETVSVGRFTALVLQRAKP
jgi:hypothetical protein